LGNRKAKPSELENLQHSPNKVSELPWPMFVDNNYLVPSVLLHSMGVSMVVILPSCAGGFGCENEGHVFVFIHTFPDQEESCVDLMKTSL
jgi:hypothetical protein